MTTKVTNVYNLKLTPSQFGQNSIVVNCSQYDSLFRVIQFNLYNGNAVYSIPEGSVVTIRGTKKDNTGFEYECDYSNNVVTFPLQQQITIFPGKVPAELRITNNGEIIGSWNFLFLVEESPLSDETIISETQLPLLEQAIEAADRLNEAFDDIAEFTDETYPNAVQAVQNEGATQVANVTNEGTTQKGLVTSEGTTQIANVQAEGTTQVGNVQAKGTEVLDSIPSDYTELSKEVSDLETKINNLYEQNFTTNIAQGNNWFSFDFVAGRTYKLTNTGSTGVIVPHTVGQLNSTDFIERIGTEGIGAGGSVLFTPTLDAPVLYVYTTENGSVNIYQTLTLTELDDKIDTDIATVNNNITTQVAGLKDSVNNAWNVEKTIGDFVVGDFYQGTIVASAFRMAVANKELFVSTILTADWSKYTVYVHKFNGASWTGLGWKTTDTLLESGKYGFVVERANQSQTALTADEQAEINNTVGYKSIFASRDDVKIVKLENHYPRLMNRQGEGYDYPDNSIEGVLSALNDGYRKIRIGVASTSDYVYYVTHSYEMEHNSTSNCLTNASDGTAYTQDVQINNVTSEFIDSLLYKGYKIPTLEEMLDKLCQYDVEITLELKDSYFSTVRAQKLLEVTNYYNLKFIYSGSILHLRFLYPLTTELDLAVIFQYTDALAEQYTAELEGKYKTLRFDCYWSDTITKESILTYIHPKYKLKLGGVVVTFAEALAGMKYCDVCEVNFKLSAQNVFQ